MPLLLPTHAAACTSPPLTQVGKLVVDALLKSGRSERIDATPERLDGISLTV